MSEQTTLDSFGSKTGSDHSERGKKYRNPEWLQAQYYGQGKNLSDLAEACDVSTKTISNWMDKHDIERRSISKARAEGNVKPLHDRDWVYEHYVEQECSTHEIAEELGVDRGTVSNWLDRHDIKKRGADGAGNKPVEELQNADWLREQYHGQEKTTLEIAGELNTSATTVRNWIDRHNIEFRTHAESLATGDISKLQNCQWLRRQYVEQNRPASDIAQQLNLSGGTVRRWLSKHGIEMRSLSEELSDGQVKRLHDEDWLETQYVEKGRTTTEIADELGVATGTVAEWMRRHEISLRTVSESKSDGNVRPLHDRDWLRTQYVEKSRTTEQIGDDLDVSANTVYEWLHRHDIELRTGMQNPDHLDHVVRSDWELDVADLLNEANVEYSYEPIEISFGEDRTYTPDFVTEGYVIEVKGYVYEEREEEKRARAAMNQLDDREYVVVGTKLPADHYIPWEDRDQLLNLVS